MKNVESIGTDQNKCFELIISTINKLSNRIRDFYWMNIILMASIGRMALKPIPKKKNMKQYSMHNEHPKCDNYLSWIDWLIADVHEHKWNAVA